ETALRTETCEDFVGILAAARHLDDDGLEPRLPREADRGGRGQVTGLVVVEGKEHGLGAELSEPLECRRRGLRGAAESHPVDRLATAQRPRPPDEAVELPFDEHRLLRLVDRVSREIRTVERSLLALPAEALSIEDPLLGPVRGSALEPRDSLAV